MQWSTCKSDQSHSREIECKGGNKKCIRGFVMWNFFGATLWFTAILASFWLFQPRVAVFPTRIDDDPRDSKSLVSRDIWGHNALIFLNCWCTNALYSRINVHPSLRQRIACAHPVLVALVNSSSSLFSFLNLCGQETDSREQWFQIAFCWDSGLGARTQLQRVVVNCVWMQHANAGARCLFIDWSRHQGGMPGWNTGNATTCKGGYVC